MEKYFKEITKVFKNNNFDSLENASNEKKLLYLYAFYHYFYGDEDKVYEVEDGCDFNRANNNKAYGFFNIDDYGENEFDILSVLYYENDEVIKFDSCSYIFTEIEAMINQINNKFYSYNTNNSKIKEYEEYFNSDSTNTIKIKIITNCILDSESKTEFQTKVSNLGPRIENLEFEVVFGDDIIADIEDVVAPKNNVELSQIVVQRDNYLFFGEEKSIICNVRASSIKENYKKYGRNGLFAQNLRFYVKNGKVDAGITNSIKENGEKFWYLNNGIIIICDDYKIVEDKIILRNFSIINGGQTTRMIGETSFRDDFYIQCKVIKNKYVEEKDKLGFVSEIAEASNTQKPIKATDLVANKPEQRMLKVKLENAKVFCQIKRGESPANPKVNYPEAWQKTKNDEIAQLIYATIFQKPGAARNNKSEICTKENIYNAIFSYDYSADYLVDLLKLRSHYKKWGKYVADNSEDPIKKGIVKNGMFFMLSSIVLVAKCLYSQDYCNLIKENLSDDVVKKNLISKIIFDHKILSKSFNESTKDVFELFEKAYDRYIKNAFNLVRLAKPDMSYSNFTKVDSNYFNYVVKFVLEDLIYGLHPAIAETVSKVFYKQNDIDKSKTREFFDIIVNYNEPEVVSENDDPVLDALRDDLKKFRTETYKANRIKAYEVFNNEELENILKFKPKSVKELKEFGCLKVKPSIKIRRYGDAIVARVTKYYKENN